MRQHINHFRLKRFTMTHCLEQPRALINDVHALLLVRKVLNHRSSRPIVCSSDQIGVKEHLIKITNLSPGTTYSYRLRSTDPAENTFLSDLFTLKSDIGNPILRQTPIRNDLTPAAPVTWAEKGVLLACTEISRNVAISLKLSVKGPYEAGDAIGDSFEVATGSGVLRGVALATSLDIEKAAVYLFAANPKAVDNGQVAATAGFLAAVSLDAVGGTLDRNLFSGTCNIPYEGPLYGVLVSGDVELEHASLDKAELTMLVRADI